jgi:hypothetical protein
MIMAWYRGNHTQSNAGVMLSNSRQRGFKVSVIAAHHSLVISASPRASDQV